MTVSALTQPKKLESVRPTHIATLGCSRFRLAFKEKGTVFGT